MKTILISSAIFLSLLFTSATSGAQTGVRLNVGSQPVWGPVGYDYAEYYYLPEYEAYYSVPKHQFVYPDKGRWVFVSALPQRFGKVNLYSTYKVVVNEPRAYLHFNDHKIKYKGNGGQQIIIRDSKEPKYFVVKGHPEHGHIQEREEHSEHHYESKQHHEEHHEEHHQEQHGGEGNAHGNKGGGKGKK